MSFCFARQAAELPSGLDEYLAARLERNVQASLIAHVRAGRMAREGQLFAWQAGEEGPRAFAMRLPPWPLLVGDLDASLAGALLEAWLPQDGELPGVSGVPAAARAIAARWERLTGGRSKLQISEAMHVLEQVLLPGRPPAGALRLAAEPDRSLLIEWERGFVAEAGLPQEVGAEAERTIERRLSARMQHVWDDRGPVSTLGLSPLVGGVVRVGPVYTPPGRRNRGYASIAVARACERALDRGAERCMLYTDLANPTSNKIYAALGFQRCGDWEEHRFSAS